MTRLLSETATNAYHHKVVEAPVAIGDPAYGRAVQKDRGSKLADLPVSSRLQ